MGDELGESQSPGGRIRGIPEEAGVLARKVPYIYVRKVLPARKASARKNLPAREGCFAWARLPALWQWLSRDRDLDNDYCD